MTQMATQSTAGAQPPLFGYISFYKGGRKELHATSLFAAKEKAIELFKPPKSQRHMVSVVLAERPDGSSVTHVPDF